MLLPQCPSQESITVIYILRFATGLISLDIPKCAKTFHYILRKIYYNIWPFCVFALVFLNVFETGIYIYINVSIFYEIFITQIQSPIFKIQISSHISQFSLQHILQLNIQITSRFFTVFHLLGVTLRLTPLTWFAKVWKLLYALECNCAVNMWTK